MPCGGRVEGKAGVIRYRYFPDTRILEFTRPVYSATGNDPVDCVVAHTPKCLFGLLLASRLVFGDLVRITRHSETEW